MKLPSVMIACVFPLLGVPLGYFVKGGFFEGGFIAEKSVAAGDAGRGELAGISAERGGTEQVPRLVTGETLESLIADGDGVSYAELSLWLLDAEADEIAAFWKNFQKGEPGGDLKRLLFINWTRLDPQGAINAVKGTEHELIVWWAWAAHDPATAMAAADPEMQKRVAKGAGEFHPEWVRENFDSIPKDAQRSAIDGIRTWKEDEDHAATLDFLVEHGSSPGNLFKTFARKDPWGAYEWLEANGRLKVSRNGRNQELDALIGEMKDLHPDELEQMAAMIPSGAVKRKMEDAAFDNLLARDPEKALAKAREGKAPLVNAKRLAAIGASLPGTETERAFDLAGEILSITEGKLTPVVRAEYGSGSTRSYTDERGTKDFIFGLLEKEPYRILDMATVAVGEASADMLSDMFEPVVEKDPGGFAEWVNRQADDRSRARGSDVLLTVLTNRGRFSEAKDWALNGYDPQGGLSGGLTSFFSKWSQQDKEGARAWLETAPVSDRHRVTLKSVVDYHFR